jgi:hypothetical protein
VTQSISGQTAVRLARFGGLLYLIIIVIGALGEAVVRGSIVVQGDAAATSQNLRSMEWLWRLGLAGESALLVCATALAVILYVLLRPVNRAFALAAVFFNLICIAIEGVAAVFLAVALIPINNPKAFSALTPSQLDAASMLAIQSHSYGFGIALIFFGVECIILGHLIARSGYMPRVIGRLMQVAGVCYLLNSFALLLSPPLSNLLFPAILLPALVGELSFALWLVVKGVRPGDWAA